MMPDAAPHEPTEHIEKGIHHMSGTTSAGGGNALTTSVVSVSPIALPAAPDRGQHVQVRVTAPTTGHHLPVVVFSHSMSLTIDDYAPLVGFWAARGFVVIQPAHLDSLGLAPDDPRTPLIWRIRTEDLTCILDRLDHADHLGQTGHARGP